jgi:hypothetical protein
MRVPPSSILLPCAEYIESLSIGYGAEQMQSIAANLDAGSSEAKNLLLTTDAARVAAEAARDEARVAELTG